MKINKNIKIAIIGAGLAGTAAAYVLSQKTAHFNNNCGDSYDDNSHKNSNTEIDIFEAAPAPASGASGNDVGLYNPRFFAEYSSIARFYWQAFHQALAIFEAHSNHFDYNPCGAIHLINTEQKLKRFNKMANNWPIKKDEMSLITKAQASDIAGIELHHDALYLPQSGTISPNKLCRFYIKQSGAKVHYNHPIDDAALSQLQADYDAVIIACAYQAKQLKACAHLPLKPVRGQITQIQSSQASANLKTVICYGGYFTPSINNAHTVGSTFNRGIDTNTIKQEDNAQNITKMTAAIPTLAADNFTPIKARASVRTTAPDHQPIIGQLLVKTLISLAHGSHGILSSLMGAFIIRDAIMGDRSVDQDIVETVSAYRFSYSSSD